MIELLKVTAKYVIESQRRISKTSVSNTVIRGKNYLLCMRLRKGKR